MQNRIGPDRKALLRTGCDPRSGNPTVIVLLLRASVYIGCINIYEQFLYTLDTL